MKKLFVVLTMAMLMFSSTAVFAGGPALNGNGPNGSTQGPSNDHGDRDQTQAQDKSCQE